MIISSRQLLWTIWLFQIGMTILLTTSLTVKIANRDSWISVCLAIIGAVVITLVCVQVSLYHPDKTLFDIAQTVFGTWIGKLLMIPYCLTWISETSVITRKLADFVQLTLLHQTPIWVIEITFISLIVYIAIHGGLKGAARLSEILGPIVLCSFVVAFLFSINNMHINRLEPIYQPHMIYHVVFGAVPALSFFGEIVIVCSLVCYVEDKHDIYRKTLSGLFITGGVVVVYTVGIISVFGPRLPAQLTYPAFEFIRVISLMGFIQSIESVFVVIWICSMFIKVVVYFCITDLNLRVWLPHTSRRSVIYILSVTVLIMAIFLPYSFTTDIYLNKIWIPYIFPVNDVCIPLLLLVGSAIYHHRSQTKYRK